MFSGQGRERQGLTATLHVYQVPSFLLLLEEAYATGTVGMRSLGIMIPTRTSLMNQDGTDGTAFNQAIFHCPRLCYCAVLLRYHVLSDLRRERRSMGFDVVVKFYVQLNS